MLRAARRENTHLNLHDSTAPHRVASAFRTHAYTLLASACRSRPFARLFVFLTATRAPHNCGRMILYL